MAGNKQELKKILKIKTEREFEVKRMLEITTVVGCPNMCNFCPQDAFLNSYKNKERRLSYENFEKVIENLPKDVLINFAGFSEPFLNHDAVKMIKLANKKGFRVDLYTTIVGLNENLINELSECNLESIILHVPDNKGNTHIIQAGGKDYAKNLELFLQKMNVTNIMSMNENMFENNGRAGLVTKIKRKAGPFRCFDNKLKYPQFVMLPNCDVALCCMDFGIKHNLGNLLVSTFDEIENSKKYKTIKAEQNKFGVHNTICGECLWAQPLLENKIKLGVIKILELGLRVHSPNLEKRK